MPCRWNMISSVLEPTISELAASPDMPDACAIRAKMKRRIQNNRSKGIKKIGELSQGKYNIDVVDALLARLFPNTPGAKRVQVTETAAAALADMEESELWDGEETLVDIYNHLVPNGHATLKLDGASDPRLLEARSE